MTVVKICGITRFEDAIVATEAGADMIGFNFYKKSPRALSVVDAIALCHLLRDRYGRRTPLLIGVFVNEVVSNVASVMAKIGLDFAQFSGSESDVMLKEMNGRAYKAIQPSSEQFAMLDVNQYMPYMPTDERVPSLLLDAYHPKLHGGTGEVASIDVARRVRDAVPRLMLAGGLTPDNVAERARAVGVWGVDVASGVEAGQPGVKDAQKMRDFIQRAKAT